jgi:hypothetical protein
MMPAENTRVLRREQRRAWRDVPSGAQRKPPVYRHFHVDTPRAGDYRWSDDGPELHLASDWKCTPDGNPCPWCAEEVADFPPLAGPEPADLDDALNTLCRGHAAEYAGESIASMGRAERAAYGDMEDLGYFD